MKKSNYIVLDCETGGLDPEKNPITQIALVAIDNNFKEVNRFETYVKPYNDLEITSGALKATGLKMSDINNGVELKKLVSLITEFFKTTMPKNHPSYRPVIVGHNLTFDIGFIDYAFKAVNKSFSDIRNGNPICTMTLMKMYKPTISSLALGVCCSEMGIELIGAHHAMPDTLATTKLFTILSNKMRNASNDETIQLKTEKKARQTFQF